MNKFGIYATSLGWRKNLRPKWGSHEQALEQQQGKILRLYDWWYWLETNKLVEGKKIRRGRPKGDAILETNPVAFIVISVTIVILIHRLGSRVNYASSLWQSSAGVVQTTSWCLAKSCKCCASDWIVWSKDKPYRKWGNQRAKKTTTREQCTVM